jgi:hypothetical protein
MADDDDPDYNSIDDENEENYFGGSDEENDDVVGNIAHETIDSANRIIKANPIVKAYRKVKTKIRTAEELAAFKVEVEVYLRDLFSLPFCFARFQGCFVTCHCIQLNPERWSFTALAARLGEWFYCSLFSFYQSSTNLFFSFVR